MNPRLIFFLILGIDALVLFVQTSELSISYREAQFLQADFSFFQLLINFSLFLFGMNDFALRFPMILLHLMSVVLMYKIAKDYLTDKNRTWLILVFVLLPGIVSSALIVDSAGLLIFCLLLFVYLFSRVSLKVLLVYLACLALIDSGFLYLFFGLIWYGMYIKNYKFSAINFLFLLVSIALFGLDVHGSPRGYFLDAIGIYSAIFTPIIFVYVFYILYRRGLTREIDLLWFIATSALVLSLLLSFRQRIDVQHFAPYIVLALPLAAQTFNASYRVRLSMFRKKYKLTFSIAIAFLLINSSIVFFNKYLYLFIEDPSTHFAYKMHVVKDLAKELKDQGVECVTTNKSLALRLKFYGISKCNDYILKENDGKLFDVKSVTISYKNRAIKSYSVTKLNN